MALEAFIGGLIKAIFTPVVLVISSPSVENILKKSNLTPSHLLSKNGGVTSKVQTIGESSYEVRGFRTRFTSLYELEKLMSSQEEQESRLVTLLEQVASQNATETSYSNIQLKNRDHANELQKTIFLKDPTPWFSQFRWECLRATRITEFEFFEHPVACILMASSEEENFIEVFSSLWDERKLPAIFQKGIMDTKISRHFILVHDNQSSFDPQVKLNQMKTTFEKTKCQLLCVNSLKEPNPQGIFMDNHDWESVDNLVKEFISKGLIPYMQSKISILNEFVESSKKGIKNQLKKFFSVGRTPKERTALPDLPKGNTVYALSSIESSEKQLGDFLFMLQDYNNALNIYRSAVKDYLNDKSYLHYAAASEMAGLCTFLLEPTKRDLETYFDNACTSYMKENFNRFALRVTFFFTEILKVRRNPSEAAARLIRIADKDLDKLTSAMLHEQAAFAYLYNVPIQYRKFSFRLILAGHYFNLINQHKHAFRCYSFAYSVYESQNWNYIDDHIHFTLARQSFMLNRYDDAVIYIQKLLAKNSQAPLKQQTYLKEFLHIFNKVHEEKSMEMPNLPLPIIKNDTVRVNLSDYPPKSTEQEMWNQMKSSLKNYGKPPKLKNRRHVKTKVDKAKLCVVGETILIEVDVMNPLSIPLNFTKVHLIGTHSATINENSQNNPTFKMTPFDLLLGADETKTLRFYILPLKEGLLEIKAIGFCLSGSVFGCREFQLPQKRLNDTRQHRRGVFYAPSLDLTFKITGPMPLLDVHFSQFPFSLLQGQIEKINLEFRNSGKTALHDIRLKFSHPTYFSINPPHLDSLEYRFVEPEDSNQRIHQQHNPNQNKIKAEDPSIIILPIKSLQPNETITLPLWIRGYSSGVETFHFLFYYLSLEENTEMKYRLFRATHKTEFVPSIKTYSSTTMSYSKVNTYLLNIEVSNIKPNSTFKLHHLSTSNPFWKIEPLIQNEETIHSLQSCHMIFKILPIEDKFLFFQDKTKPPLVHTQLSLSSSHHSFGENSYPFYDFLKREKADLVREMKKELPSPFSDSASEKVLRMSLASDEKYLGSENSLDLSLIWETKLENGKFLIGQNNICNVTFLTRHNPVAQDSGPSSSVKFSINSSRKFFHDFSKQSFCNVPITFDVMNTSPTNPVSFCLETLKPTDNNELNTDNQSKKSHNYFWIGQTTHSVTDLQPKTLISLHTEACFTTPGIYNLTRFKFSVRDPVKNSFHQIYYPFQHIIIIEDSSEMIETTSN